MDDPLTPAELEALRWLDILPGERQAIREHRNVLPALKARGYVTVRHVDGMALWKILPKGQDAIAETVRW